MSTAQIVTEANKANKANEAAKSRAEEAGIDTSDWNSANLEIGGWMTPLISKRMPADLKKPATQGVVGRAVEAIQLEGEFGLQDVIKVRLAIPCEALSGSGDEQKTVLLQPGDIIAVRVSANLQTLLRCVKNECAVEIAPQGERKLKKGRKMWVYNFKYKGTLADPVFGSPAPTANSGAGSDDDNLPF